MPVWGATFTYYADARPKEREENRTLYLRADTGEVLLGDDPSGFACDAVNLLVLPRIPSAMSDMPKIP